MSYDDTEARALESFLVAQRDLLSNNTQTNATDTARTAKVATTTLAPKPSSASAPHMPMTTDKAPGSSVYDTSELRATERLIPAKSEIMNDTSEEAGGTGNATE